MNDIFDDLINTLKNNKKILILSVVIYVVIILVIIAMIWWPKEKEYLTYIDVDIKAKQEQLGKDYIDNIAIIFMSEDEEKLEKLISDDYINYTGKSKNELVKELKNDGFFSLYSEVKGLDIYEDGQTYIYTTTIYSNENSRKINIIETYPYKYTIAFDDFYSYKEENKSVTSEDIKVTIKNEYRNMKYIKYDISIENFNNTYARFDFNSSDSVQAVLKDGTTYSAVNLVSTESYTNINPNMILNKNFVFEIPAQLQNNIEYIVFNGVSLEFSEMNLKVNL